MESRNVTNKTLSCIAIFMLVIGLANSDLDKDREECTDQLVGLATCLPYVGGDSKAPTLDCCAGLKEVLAKGKKCLCILIKDRDDPKLGIKINGTLALSLPDVCHSPANISACTEILHLKPHSPEAKIFEQYANSTKSNGTISTPVPSDKGSSSGNGTSSSSLKNDGGFRGKIRWLGVEMICGVLLWCFTLHLIYNA